MLQEDVLLKRVEEKPYDFSTTGGMKGTSFKAYFLFPAGQDVVMKISSKDVYEKYKDIRMAQGDVKYNFVTGKGASIVQFESFDEK